MPKTAKGRKIMASMRKTYPTKKKAEEVFFASANKGTITGVHKKRKPAKRKPAVRRRRKT